MITFKIFTHEIRTPTKSKKKYLAETSEEISERTAKTLIGFYKEDFKRYQEICNAYTFNK